MSASARAPAVDRRKPRSERPDPSRSPPPSGKRKVLRGLLGISGYVVLVAVAWQTLDHDRFIAGLRQLSAAQLGSIVALSALHMGGRALRFHRLMLRCNPEKYRWHDGARIFLAGVSLSLATPGRVGDVVKARLVQAHAVPWNLGLGLVMIERTLDLLVIAASILAAGPGLAATRDTGPSMFVALMVLLFLVGVATIVTSRRVRSAAIKTLVARVARLRRSSDQERLAGVLGGIFSTWDGIFTSPLTLIRYLLLTVVVWLVDFSKLYLVLLLLGAPVPFLVPLFVYPVSVLAGVVSEGLVGLAGVALLVSLTGLDPTIAGVAFVIDRAISTLTPVISWGIFAIARRPASPAQSVAGRQL